MWKVVTFCILLAFSGIVSWWADELPWLRKFEYQLWDLRTELVADPQNARKDIKIVVIDQRSLNALEKEDLTWPWPRPIYKPVVEWLKGAGAKGIGFDILFTETGVSGLVDDREFASAFTRDFPAVHVASAGDGQGSIPVDLPLASISPEISAIISKRSFSRATFPIEELYPGTSIVGLVTVEADEDGIFRRMPLGATVFGKPFYSLAFALYAATHKDESIDWVAPYSTDDGSVIVRLHGGSETFRTYSFADVLAVAVGGSPSEEITAQDFKGSYVLVGVWAPGLQDLRPVSLGRTEYRGVEFHAATLDNILSQSFVTETSRTIDVLFGVFLTALVSSCVLFLPTPALSVVIASLVVVAAVLFTVMLADAGVWIALAAPLLSVVTAITGSLWLQFLFEGRQRKFLRRAFSHYVNPSIVSQIVNDPTHLSLGGQKKRVSVYFSDLAGFTTLSEKLSTEQLTHFLNWYLGEMTEIVLREDGTLDKYEGDAIIAFWNAPLDIPHHERRAARAAVDCLKRLNELRPEFEQKLGISPYMRIGIHSGEATVGNFGSGQRFDYTVIGDTANLASRLEGLNKMFGTAAMVSEDTERELDDTILRRYIGTIQVVGRKQPVRVFELLTDGIDIDAEGFSEALALFEERKWEEAQEKFLTLENDTVAKAYLGRIDSELSLPERDPIWRMTKK